LVVLIALISLVYIGLAVLGLLAAVTGQISAWYSLVQWSGFGFSATYPTALVVGFMSFVQLVMSYGLWKMKRWALWLTVMLCILGAGASYVAGIPNLWIPALLTIVVLLIYHGRFREEQFG
jgi:hypothetical protein